MSGEPRCLSCDGPLGDGEGAAGQCLACAWRPVRRALRLERQAAVLIWWGCVLAILTEAVLFGLLTLDRTLRPQTVGDVGTAAFVTGAGWFVLITQPLMLRAMWLYWASSPAVQLRVTALAALACLAASGLALLAAIGVSVSASERDVDAGLALPVLLGGSVLLWFLAHVVHIEYLRQLAAACESKTLKAEFASLNVIVLTVPPTAFLIQGGLLTFWYPRSPSAAALFGALLFQSVLLLLISRFVNLLKRLQAMVPPMPQKAPASSPYLAAALPDKEPSP